MQLPKFILGDNSDFPNAIYVIHTEFPRFIINLEDDELEWFEDFDEEDEDFDDEEVVKNIDGSSLLRGRINGSAHGSSLELDERESEIEVVQ